MASLCPHLVSSSMLSTACKSSAIHSSIDCRSTLTGFTMEFNKLCFTLDGKRAVKALSKLPIYWHHQTLHRVNRRRLSVYCQRTDGDGDKSGEEPPETLFMKELKRRGMTPASLLEDSDRSPYGQGGTETKTREEGSEGFTNRNDIGTFTGFDDRRQANQRARSMALNSEGLEGLIPRAKVLLTLGGTFFFVFWPLILGTVAIFAAVYIYFGPSFIHDGVKNQVAQPTYIDPYKLLEDERLAPQLGSPRVPYTSQ
eukprot:Gb_39920 [translate_table: standard]